MNHPARTFIVCELAQTHEGHLDFAKLLVKAAAAAGADAIKVQVFTADELCVPGYKHYKLFKSLEWPDEDWRRLADYSHECGVRMFADVFGVTSLKMLTRIGIDGLKIHGTDMRNAALLQSIAAVDLPVLLSAGGATLDEIGAAVETLSSPGRTSPIVLMAGFQNYPTRIEVTHLNRLRLFKERFGLPVGYADHIDGTSSLRFELCTAAVAMGATYLEKHITLSRCLKMEDYESALTPDEFVSFVETIRNFESALGPLSAEMGDAELSYRKDTRKHVVAAGPISAGQKIAEADVTLRRAPSDNQPSDLADVLGKRARKDYVANDVIVLEDLSE